MNVPRPVPRLIVLVVAAALPAAAAAQAEKHTQSTLESRMVVSLRVNAEDLQRRLPAPWQVQPAASGPTKDANLNVSFIERALDLDAEGKPTAHPSYRVIALGVPARNPQTNESGPMLVRLYHTSPDHVPGFYKVAELVEITRELKIAGRNLELGAASDQWSMKDERGNTVDLQVTYQRGVPSRVKLEARPRSGLDPSIWRLYRVEQANDVLKSMASGVDRTTALRFQAKLAEFASLFDGSEQVLAVTSVPWYTRQTFVPAM